MVRLSLLELSLKISHDGWVTTKDLEFTGSVSGRLNWLRAGVLGANDGIVSTAAIVLGVAGATDDRGPVLLAGVVGLLAGALSMAVGEYVSVSTQRDTERAMIVREQDRLSRQPDRELAGTDRRLHGKRA